MSDEAMTSPGGRMQVPRTRGAISGAALIVLGAWGGLAPFLGPYFNFAFTPEPNTAWHWTAARGWFEVLPGGVALFGGLLLLFSANRAMTSFGAWISIAAGAWFVVGRSVSPLLTLGTPGNPANGGQREQVAELLVYFLALGAAIVMFGALAAGRLSVHSVRDVRVAARRDAEAQAAEQERVRAEGEQRREEEAQREAEAAPVATAASAGQSVDQPAAPAEAVPPPVMPAAQPAYEARPAEPVYEAQSAPLVEPPAAASTEPEPSPSTEATVATSERPDAPYAPDGHTPEATEPPLDATPQQGGPAYATPQRYVRPPPSEQIPVEQLQRDHPTE